LIPGNPANATKVTASAMRDGASSTIEIQLKVDGRNYNRKLEVMVDGVEQYLDEDWQQWKTFHSTFESFSKSLSQKLIRMIVKIPISLVIF
jgi:hypothetical protein